MKTLTVAQAVKLVTSIKDWEKNPIKVAGLAEELGKLIRDTQELYNYVFRTDGTLSLFALYAKKNINKVFYRSASESHLTLFCVSPNAALNNTENLLVSGRWDPANFVAHNWIPVNSAVIEGYIQISDSYRALLYILNQFDESAQFGPSNAQLNKCLAYLANLKKQAEALEISAPEVLHGIEAAVVHVLCGNVAKRKCWGNSRLFYSAPHNALRIVCAPFVNVSTCLSEGDQNARDWILIGKDQGA